MESVSKISKKKLIQCSILNHTSGSRHGKNVCLSQNKSLTSAIQLISESTVKKSVWFAFFN